MFLKNIEFHKIDCCNFEKVKSIMKGVNGLPLCSYTHEGLSVFSPYEITKNNYLASVSIFSAAVNEKVKRIIFVLRWLDMVTRKHHLQKK